jgi:hypothetical protein
MSVKLPANEMYQIHDAAECVLAREESNASFAVADPVHHQMGLCIDVPT